MQEDQVHHHSSRRAVLTGLGVSGLAAAVSPLSLARAVTAASHAAKLFNIQRVTDGVYAAISRPVARINCNAAIIVGSDHALVVDTHSKPSAARALIAQIRAEITDRPVRYAVNTHFHWDHAQGNLAYPEAFGKEVEIIASSATRDWLAREGVGRLRESLDSLTKQIADLRQRVIAAKTSREREGLNARIAELEAFVKEMTPAEKQITLPGLTFEQRLIIHHGGKEVHLLFLGRGHTAGDVVVFVPREQVVATGDLMHSVLPFIGDGYPDEWVQTLTALEKLDYRRAVPGHGSVQEGKTVLASFRSYLDELNEAVRRGVERGASLEELQRELAAERLRSLRSNDNGTRVMKEMSAAFALPVAPSEALKSTVASNVSDVYNYYGKRRKQSG